MPNRENKGIVTDSMTKMMANPATDAKSMACHEKFIMRSASWGTPGAICATATITSVTSRPAAMPSSATFDRDMGKARRNCCQLARSSSARMVMVSEKGIITPTMGAAT